MGRLKDLEALCVHIEHWVGGWAHRALGGWMGTSSIGWVDGHIEHWVGGWVHRALGGWMELGWNAHVQ